MKRFSEQLNKKAQSIRLSKDEQLELRERLVSYMEYHPIGGVQSKSVVVNHEPVLVLNFDIKRILQWSGVAAVVIVSGVSYIAERAVPGDALYAVKIGVNEEIRSTLARSSYEKVVWETERLNRRIAEARVLADSGRLTTEMETKMAEAVRSHSDKAKKEIENLKLTDADEATLASIELSTALDVQSASLRVRQSQSPETGSLIEDAILASLASDTPLTEENLPAYERLMARVELETTRAQELLSGVNSAASEEEKVDIARRLSDIDRNVTEAMGVAETDNLPARKLLVEALQKTHRLIVFMTNIDVRVSLKVDDIVPVVLTKEERIELVTKQVEETKTVLLLADEYLAATTTELAIEIKEKVEPALARTKEILVEVETALASGTEDVAGLETLVTEAMGLSSDIVKLLELKIEPVEVKVEEVVKPVETIEVPTEVIEDEQGSTTPEVTELEV
jgi:hypothetical protein